MQKRTFHGTSRETDTEMSASVSPTSGHPNGRHSNASVGRGRDYVTESKADLVSMEMDQSGRNAGQLTFSATLWQRRTRLEKLLIVLVALMFVVLIAILAITISKSVRENGASSGSTGQNHCNTPGCIAASHALLQNMDHTVDPCDDFYQYACGGFEERVR